MKVETPYRNISEDTLIKLLRVDCGRNEKIENQLHEILTNDDSKYTIYVVGKDKVILYGLDNIIIGRYSSGEVYVGTIINQDISDTNINTIACYSGVIDNILVFCDCIGEYSTDIFCYIDMEYRRSLLNIHCDMVNDPFDCENCAYRDDKTVIKDIIRIFKGGTYRFNSYAYDVIEKSVTDEYSLYEYKLSCDSVIHEGYIDHEVTVLNKGIIQFTFAGIAIEDDKEDKEDEH